MARLQTRIDGIDVVIHTVNPATLNATADTIRINRLASAFEIMATGNVMIKMTSTRGRRKK